jgi:beta-lactamase regulating signal transducer with metallopeptidase domain
MNPDLLLGSVTALTGFVLKTTLAFAVCLGLSWLAETPGRRFMVWLSFLYGTAVYWLWLAKGLLAVGKTAATTSVVVAQPMARVSALQIPGSWAIPLGIALQLLGITYLLILAYLLVTHIKKHVRLKWVLGFTSQPPDEITAAFRPLAENLGVGRSRLLVLSGVTSPATFGWIRPTILLPDACLEQDRSDIEDILRHELHHVRRWDFVWNGLAVACRALVFFHPAAWYAVKRMQFNRELACDLAAVSDSPKGRAKYAECLIHFARLNSSPQSSNWGIDFAASSEHLKARVRSILAESKRPSAWLVCSRIAGGLALLAAFAAVEPSLAVLLSYARQQTAQPVATEMRTSPANTEMGVRATRKGRLVSRSTATRTDSSIANLSETAEPADLTTPRIDSGLAAQSGGPQLLHRGSAAPATGAKQQTVIQIDDASGQVGKAGDHNHEQALQQGATAAAVLKRLSTFDHH